MVTKYLESKLREEDAFTAVEIQAGGGWLHRIEKGQVVRIVDSCGNQAVDTLFINADDIAERYSVQQTVQRQKNALVGVGTQLMSNDDNVMLEVIADTCGDHDTLGSACSCESNQIRYAFTTRYMHACRDTFLKLALTTPNLDKRDIVNNLNFFMYVPFDADGNLNFADGISAPGKYIELEARMNVYVLISNCPQLNNPCNGYNPTPVKALIWEKRHV
jgi:urea carboxylase-associated protein 1